MGNSRETLPFSKLVVEVDGKDYEMAGGSGGQVGPDSVDSRAIIDDGIMPEDLNDRCFEDVTDEEIDDWFEDD